MKTRDKFLWLDQTGITASLACAIHCAALPLVATLLPLWGLEFLANPLTELLMLSFALCIGLFTLLTTFRNHGKIWPISFLLVGFFTIGLGNFITNTEAILIPLGGIFIAAAHLLNIKANKNLKTHSHLKP